MIPSKKIPINENVSAYDFLGGQEYTSFAAWEAATDRDLVLEAAGETLECCKGCHFDSLDIGGARTDPDYWRCVRSEAFDDWQGFPVICGLVIVDGEDFVQIQNVISSFLLMDGDHIACVGCISLDSQNAYELLPGENQSHFVINCMSKWSRGPAVIAHSGTSFIYNFTDDEATEFSLEVHPGATVFAKNCIFSQPVENRGSLGQLKNVRDPVKYKNFALHLSHLDTAAKNKGADLSKDENYPFNDDILGHERQAPWDVGYHEHVLVAETVVLKTGTLTFTGQKSKVNQSVKMGAGSLTVNEQPMYAHDLVTLEKGVLQITGKSIKANEFICLTNGELTLVGKPVKVDDFVVLEKGALIFYGGFIKVSGDDIILGDSEKQMTMGMGA